MPRLSSEETRELLGTSTLEASEAMTAPEVVATETLLIMNPALPKPLPPVAAAAHSTQHQQRSLLVSASMPELSLRQRNNATKIPARELHSRSSLYARGSLSAAVEAANREVSHRVSCLSSLELRMRGTLQDDPALRASSGVLTLPSLDRSVNLIEDIRSLLRQGGKMYEELGGSDVRARRGSLGAVEQGAEAAVVATTALPPPKKKPRRPPRANTAADPMVATTRQRVANNESSAYVAATLAELRADPWRREQFDRQVQGLLAARGPVPHGAIHANVASVNKLSTPNSIKGLSVCHI